LSFDMRIAQGSVWNCIAKPGVHHEMGKPISAGEIECGAHPVKGDIDLRKPPFIRLGSFAGERQPRDYDGFVWLGPVVGSPPLSEGK
jgi:hypothetical protein